MAVPFLTGITLNNQRAQAMASPSTGTDGANKDYVDARVAGLAWKEAVRAASTANVDISQLNNGDALDGITVATGDRVLLKDQSTGGQNGIYVVGATAGTTVRATDADSTTELHNATVFVREGTVNADNAYVQNANITTVDTTAQTWVEFGTGAGTTYTFGDGLVEAGGDVDIELTANSGLSLAGGTLGVASSIAGNALTLTSGVLDVAPGTGLEISSDTIRIAAAAAGDGLTGGAGSALAVNVGDGLEIASDAVAIDLAASSGLAFSSGDLTIDTGVVVRKFSQDIGDGSTTAIAVTHNLGTKDIVASVRRLADDVVVYVDVVATSTTVATFTFASAQATNAYRVTIHG